MNSIVNVIESYKLSDGKIIAFLKYDQGKLPVGTILCDTDGKQWQVKQYFWRTGSIAYYRERTEEEAQNIFQYLLDGHKHGEKPLRSTSVIIRNSA